MGMFDDDITGRGIGFVGIGNIGFPMAQNVLKADFDVTASDIRDDVLDEFVSLGGDRAESPYDLAMGCRSIHLVVQDAEQIDSVCDGETGLFAALEEKDEASILVIHSTVLPETCRSVAEEAPADVAVLDAPLSGAEPRAEDGDVTFMIGGEASILEYIRPVLRPMARRIFHMGGLGTGEVAKLSNNAISISNMMTTAEGIELARAHDIERDQFLEVLEDSSANSFMVQNWEFFSEEFGESHPDGFRGLAHLCEKDVSEALELAKGTEVEMVGTAVASQRVPQLWRDRADE